MAQPTFRRFWIKQCGDVDYPQFDDDGKEHAWKEYDVKPDSVRFVPFSPELAAKVGDIAEPSTLPEIEIPVSEAVEWCRPSKLKLVPHTVCGFCGAELREGTEAVCPRCFATHHWYCDRCDKFQADPKFDDRQTALCPDCPEPRGLMRINQLYDWWEERHFHYQVLEVDGRRRLVFDFKVTR